MSLYHRALSQLRCGGEISREFYNAVHDPPIHFRRTLLDGKGRRYDCTPYVVCFSINLDNEHMSEYCGWFGGWIEFNTDIRQFGHSEIGSHTKIDELGLLVLYQVIYDSNEIVKELKNLIMEFYSVCGEFEFTSECIGECLSRYRLIVKSPKDDRGKKTQGEREIRLVYFLPDRDTVEACLDDVSDFIQIDETHIAIPIFSNRFNEGLSISIHSKHKSTLKKLAKLAKEKGMSTKIDRDGCKRSNENLKKYFTLVLKGPVGDESVYKVSMNS